ncbi:hypothetical protein OC834_002232 [Tilletia horrida]|nr:hypothetical protein OC834_002232 [Tilletia horrida]
MATRWRTARPFLVPHLRTVAISAGVGCWAVASAIVINDHLVSISPCGGPSMLPTLPPVDTFLVTFKWPLYRLLDRVQRWTEWTEAQRLERIEREVEYARTAGRPLRRGDIVSALVPTSNKAACKRVVGLPGDTILLDPRAMPLPRSAWLSCPSAANSQTSAVSESTRTSRWFDAVQTQDESHGGKGDEADHDDDNDNAPTMRPDGVIGSLRSEASYITVPKGHVFLAGDNLANSRDSRDYGPVPLALIQGRVVAQVKQEFLWRRVWPDAGKQRKQGW